MCDLNRPIYGSCVIGCCHIMRYCRPVEAVAIPPAIRERPKPKGVKLLPLPPPPPLSVKQRLLSFGNSLREMGVVVATLHAASPPEASYNETHTGVVGHELLRGSVLPPDLGP